MKKITFAASIVILATLSLSAFAKDAPAPTLSPCKLPAAGNVCHRMDDDKQSHEIMVRTHSASVCTEAAMVQEIDKKSGKALIVLNQAPTEVNAFYVPIYKIGEAKRYDTVEVETEHCQERKDQLAALAKK